MAVMYNIQKHNDSKLLNLIERKKQRKKKKESKQHLRQPQK